ncbi:MAG: exonuclease domain-containing protein [Clostridia bacterium]|nr:exonuclease domain-containing protein [Clostridia bacterium]
MNYIVLDMEWNQPYAPVCVERAPFPLIGEIIQIGAVMLSDDGGRLEIIDEFKETISPTYYTKLHKGVKKVTGLSQSDISNGRPFPEAIFDFRIWCGSPCVLLTWGRDDIPMLLDNLFVHNIDAKWITDCYDLQPIYNAQTDGQKQQRALSLAMEHFEIALDEDRPAHDALNDAYYTAQVCMKLDLDRGIAEYGSEGKFDLGGYFTHISSSLYSGFESRQAALCDRKISVVTCPVCGKTMPYPLWVKQSGSKKIAMCHCEDHGDYMVRVQFFKGAGGVLKACKTLYKATDEVKAYYNDKYELFISRDPSLARGEEDGDKPRRRRRRHRGGRRKKAAEAETPVVETVSE